MPQTNETFDNSYAKLSSIPDLDPQETREWLESLDYILQEQGPERAAWLLNELELAAVRSGATLTHPLNTPYLNTILPQNEPPYPGDRELERRIKSLVRWNAMAMVVRANKDEDGLGGHISTYASSATLLEVAFNHFFRGNDAPGGGDFIYFQGHASPGVYARAYLEGRLTESQLINFRREMAEGGGLSSYPHPWLMPDFWQFPTVSMGLGPLGAIYNARFLRYLNSRGLQDTSNRRVWAFLGDGECDEPETLGCLTMAARERLDNLTFVVNCNLQRLDGPVRGNGKIIQELESLFRGAGWNVIKVVWGSEWDPIFAMDKDGLLAKRMMEVVDGQYQKYSVSSGDYVRQDFFGKYPELLKLAERLSDEQVQHIRRGGHDPIKVFTAYHSATNHKGQPTVILAKTIKGYGLGDAAEGKNVAHQQKKLQDQIVLQFRTRFGIPLNDEDATQLPFYKPAADSPEMKYLAARRKDLGGPIPSRKPSTEVLPVPSFENMADIISKMQGREISTTMAFVSVLTALLADKSLGKYLVPIIPDEARTFGMEALFRKHGIYSSHGQLYEPVDSDQLLYYRESGDGQILQEGINEGGSMASFIAAGTSYANTGTPMVPFYTFYSMFGFQRVGDLIWAAADMRCKGFLCGGTAGRTTLNGEGLQHQDGHSLLLASPVPNLLCYDPAFGYEIAAIVADGLRRMFVDQESIFYYITLQNENYEMLKMPENSLEGILKGLYKVRPSSADKPKLHAQLFGSGSIILQVFRAQEILAEKYGVSTDVWSATSYKELRRDALEAARWNMLHPEQPQRTSYLASLLKDTKGPVVAASDYVRQVPEQIAPWVPGGLTVLGCDGFGRSESRANLRRHFEVDAEHITVATLYALSQRGELPPATVAAAIRELGVNPEQAFSLYA